MDKARKPPFPKVKNILELSGKPLFYLITFLSLLIVATILLIKKILHSIKLPNLLAFRKPFISKIAIPKIPTLPIIKRPKFSRSLKFPNLPYIKFAIKFIAISLTLVSLSYIFYDQIIRDLPSPYDLYLHEPTLSTKIYDRNGILLYQIYKDENRTLVNLEDLPRHLILATISAEDKDFYSHRGISLPGIARAFNNNITRQTKQGGSTITQQLIKNTLLSPEKTFKRKVKEVILSIWTEKVLSKDEILELYLNEVSYGGTAYGIEEASKQYFAKSSRDLTLAESALLAGLPASPTTYSPIGKDPYLAKIRQQQTLREMFENKYISELEMNDALRETITLKSDNISILAPHFVMFTRDYLATKYTEDIVSKDGLEVTTTLDLQLQNMLEEVLREELDKIRHLNVTNAAGLIIDPKTGEILAMAGSINYFDFALDGQVNVALQLRQPGSAIKPITYALAFQSGLTPSSRIEDTPVTFNIPGQPPYKPKNYDNRFHGNISLRTALASSYNIPAIKLLNHLGIENMISLARALGIKTWNDPSRFGLALTLGGGDITMLDLSTVYSTFANSGYRIDPHPVLEVRNPEGKTLESNNCRSNSCPSSIQVLSPLVAYQINDILSDNSARAPAFGSNSVLNIPGHEVAVKTGTTNDLRDNWAFGYTSDYVVSIWVGNNDNSPMSQVASGITGASPIWARVMKNLLSERVTHSFSRPSELIKLSICKETNTLYCTGCPSPPLVEYYVPGTEPRSTCNFDEGKILDGLTSLNTIQ